MELTLHVRRATRALVAVVVILSLAYLLTQLASTQRNSEADLVVYRVFDFGAKKNLPTFFGSLLLLGVAGLLGMVTRSRAPTDRFRRHWALLGWAFVFLSIDKSTSLHKSLLIASRSALDVPGLPEYLWALPYALLTGVALIAYLPFLASLPARTRQSMLVAALVYLTGALALGRIAFGDYPWVVRAGHSSFLITLVEETLEMTGVVLMAHALMVHMAETCAQVRVRISDGQKSDLGATAGPVRQ